MEKCMKASHSSVGTRLYNLIIYSIIIVFTVIIVPFCNDKWQYVPMLAVMYVSPLLFLGKIKYLNTQDFLPIAIIVSIIASCLFNISSFRLSSFLYTCMFVSTFMLFEKSILTTTIRIEKMMHLLKSIVILYCIVLIVQQVSYLLNLPIINEAYGGENARSLKMNSLSIEPSNTGPIVTILVFVYIKLREFRTNHILGLKQFLLYERSLMLSYIYICIGSFSVSCLFSLLVLFSYFIDFKHLFSRNFPIIVLSVIVLGVLFYALPELNHRITDLLKAIITLDPQIIYETDSSSSARLAPPLIYLNEFSLLNPHVWLGYGMGFGGAHSFAVLSGVEIEEFTGMGGIIHVFFDYGLISGLLFIIFTYKICNGMTYSFVLFVFLIFLQFSLNHYVLWLYVFCMIIINHYTPTSKNIRTQ